MIAWFAAHPALLIPAMCAASVAPFMAGYVVERIAARWGRR